MNAIQRPRSTLLAMLVLWAAFYASFTLFTPPLLDDADSVHAEVAREMLLRHDYITLYANGIRYLEKAPLMYLSMAASMKVVQLFGGQSPRALAAAARFPIALDVLGLVWIAEMFARRMLRSARAGLYTVLILLSSFGLFLFTRMTLPDAGVCLWLTLALYAFWRTEEIGSPVKHSPGDRSLRIQCGIFAVACALNVLTKGLIGVIFPVAIVLIYLLLTRGLTNTLGRLRELHLLATLEAFLLIAAPWHILAGLANPTQGHPAAIQFVHGHWLVPNPTDGNVHGWFWFYFMNEHLLRYLNLRIPRDYDTSPLWLFWGLCFVWIMPWSAFIFKAVAHAVPVRWDKWRYHFRRHDLPLRRRGLLFLVVWSAFVLLFFSLSTRQEYYVLPALPALALLITGWLALDSETAHSRASVRITTFLLALGTLVAAFTAFLLIHAGNVAPNTDLASLLNQNPADYALSMGHFMDLTGPSIALFRFPLSIAALSLFLGPLAALILRKRAQPHAANLALAATTFGFLISVLLGLRIFSPVLTSAQLAEAIAPQVNDRDLIVIHGEYESGSTLGFYLQRPDNVIAEPWGVGTLASDTGFIHILEGRSSNLWYGSFFPDAPRIFETPETLAGKWNQPRRIFLWQSLTDPPNQLPALPGPVYVLVKSGGKEIISNQPNH
jgi:4-amino-4-deoxy-L-arabinose transferase-like glycosyltransferase